MYSCAEYTNPVSFRLPFVQSFQSHLLVGNTKVRKIHHPEDTGNCVIVIHPDTNVFSIVGNEFVLLRYVHLF